MASLVSTKCSAQSCFQHQHTLDLSNDVTAQDQLTWHVYKSMMLYEDTFTRYTLEVFDKQHKL